MKCKKCGAELNDTIKNCENCGSKNPNYTHFYIGNTPIKVSKSTFVFAIVLGVIVWFVIMFSVLGNSSNNTGTDSKPSNTYSSSETQNNTSKESNDGELGAYNVSVIGARYTSTIDGEKAVIITYSFTNNSADETFFDYAITDEVYQNGIECESLIFSNDKSYDYEMDTKKIKKGVTIEIEKAYELNDNKNDLQIELSRQFSWNDDKYEITIPLDEIKK